MQTSDHLKFERLWTFHHWTLLHPKSWTGQPPSSRAAIQHSKRFIHPSGNFFWRSPENVRKAGSLHTQQQSDRCNVAEHGLMGWGGIYCTLKAAQSSSYSQWYPDFCEASGWNLWVECQLSYSYGINPFEHLWEITYQCIQQCWRASADCPGAQDTICGPTRSMFKCWECTQAGRQRPYTPLSQNACLCLICWVKSTYVVHWSHPRCDTRSAVHDIYTTVSNQSHNALLSFLKEISFLWWCEADYWESENFIYCSVPSGWLSVKGGVNEWIGSDLGHCIWVALMKSTQFGWACDFTFLEGLLVILKITSVAWWF